MAVIAVILALIFVDVASTGGNYTNAVLDTTCDMTMGTTRDANGDCVPSMPRNEPFDSQGD